MKGTGAILERPAGATAEKASQVQLMLTLDEVGMLKAGLETLKEIYTRHEGYLEDIKRLEAKLAAIDVERMT